MKQRARHKRGRNIRIARKERYVPSCTSRVRRKKQCRLYLEVKIVSRFSSHSNESRDMGKGYRGGRRWWQPETQKEHKNG